MYLTCADMERAAKAEYLAERFWSHVGTTDDCWWWQGTKTKERHGELGYGIFHVSLDKREIAVRAHVMVLLLSGVDIPKGMFVCHECDNPPCVRPDHLHIWTPRQNNEDRDRKGRTRGGGRVGTENHHALINDAIAEDIRRRADAGEKQADIARRYGLNPTSVTTIVHGKAWAHVPYRASVEKQIPNILTPADIPTIRALKAAGVSTSEIARMFHVGHTTIRHIFSGRNWRHVQ